MTTKDFGQIFSEYNEIQDELIGALADTKFDNVTYNSDDGMIRFYSGEEELMAVGPIKGGGGGGGGGTATFTAVNTTGWIQKKVSKDSQDLIVSFNWSSIEQEQSTGAGVALITVNNVVRHTANIELGNVSFNILPYLAMGSNTVNVKISDVYDTYKLFKFRIEVADLRIESTYDESRPQTGSFMFTFTPYGSGTKTVHFDVDCHEVGNMQTDANGVQQSYLIQMQTHGAHILEVYYSIELGGEDVYSNKLRYNLITVVGTTPIIATTFDMTSASQYQTIDIPFYAYNPSSNYMVMKMLYDDEEVRQITADRTLQHFNYTLKETGEHTIQLYYSDTIYKEFDVNVTESEIDIHVETDARDLYLSAQGRSNQEENPAVWEDTDSGISCLFDGFNFRTDGWLSHNDDQSIPEGETVLRVQNGATLTIPIYLFDSSFKKTLGKTIEFQISTRNVMDYDSVVMSCYSGNRGIYFTPRDMYFKSSTASINSKYKEEEFFTVSYVINKSTDTDRVIYAYINGIMCGAVQYSSTEDFEQLNPVYITVGDADDVCIDISRIRVYHNNLSRNQILNNYIVDRSNVDDMLELYHRNNIFNSSGSINIDLLPAELPYMIITGNMPQSKGDKQTVSIQYVDRVNTGNSFTASGVQIDVQGTSSAVYPLKNMKWKAKKGFDMTQSGEHIDAYRLAPDVPATAVYTMKVNYASSELCNNTILAMLYNDTQPYDCPKREYDPQTRYSIYGFPVVMFWDTGSGVEYYSMAQFNLDKGSEAYGFDEDDGDWCIEPQNNTTDLCRWKTAEGDLDDYMGSFEFRFPDYEEEEYSMDKFAEFKEVLQWVASTDTQAAGLTSDQKTARLSKFKEEFEDYFEKDATIFYYVYNQITLGVDQIAKNTMWAKYGAFTRDGESYPATKVFPLIYDADTALGINNEGQWLSGNSFAYEYGDELPEGGYVFNASDSVLFCNLRDCFADEIKAMYQSVRISGSKLSYDYIENKYEEFQSKWPERLWNEHQYVAYVNPLLQNKGNYLAMLLGSKEMQRKYWLYNRFRYLDSKWTAGDAKSNVIQLRSYAGSDAPNCKFTLQPITDIYGTINWAASAGEANTQQQRMQHGQTYDFTCPIATLNDSEIYLYSADQLLRIGDLSRFQIDFCDFSAGINLSEIKLGDSSSSYENTHPFSGFTVGKLPLLRKLDMRNCSGFALMPDLSLCESIQEIYLDGTSATGVVLKAGQPITTLHLPETTTYLGMDSLDKLEDFVLPEIEQLTYIDIVNMPTEIFDVEEALQVIAERSIVRWVGCEYGTQRVPLDMELFITKMAVYYNKFRGTDEREHCIIEGGVWVQGYTQEQLNRLHAMFPDIKLLGNPPLKVGVSFMNEGQLLRTVMVNKGSKVVYSSSYQQPTKEPTVSTTYTWDGWLDGTEYVSDKQYNINVLEDKEVSAHYSESVRLYTIKFVNSNGTVLQLNLVNYNSTPVYTSTTPVDPSGQERIFEKWTPAIVPAVEDATYTAVYKANEDEIIKYFMRGWNDSLSESEKLKEFSIIDEDITTISGGLTIWPLFCSEIIMPNLGQICPEVKKGSSAVQSAISYVFLSILMSSTKKSLSYVHCKDFVVDVDNFCFPKQTSYPASGSLNPFLYFTREDRTTADYIKDITTYEGQDLDLKSFIYSGCGSIAFKANSVTAYHTIYTSIIAHGVKKLILPKVTKCQIASYEEKIANDLEYVDFGLMSNIPSYLGNSNNSLQDIYLHYKGIVSFGITNTSCYPKEGCYIHVHPDYVESYKIATNWSALEAYFQSNYGYSPFVAITAEETQARLDLIEAQKLWYAEHHPLE